MRGDSQCVWDGLELPCDMHADAINSHYIHSPHQQRGFNRGAPTPFNRFDNAAEYADSVDAWESPLWVDSGVVDRKRGQGYFLQAPQNQEPGIHERRDTVGPCAGRTYQDLDFSARRQYGGKNGPWQTAEQHIMSRHVNPANAQTAGQYNSSLRQSQPYAIGNKHYGRTDIMSGIIQVDPVNLLTTRRTEVPT